MGGLPASTEQACRAGDSGGLFWGGGDSVHVYVHVFFFGKHPAGVGTAARILSQEGQVCHLNTDGISLPRSTEGRKNNSTLHLDHASLQSASTDGSFEPGHDQG